jgi:CRP-like cAMP-binding protein
MRQKCGNAVIDSKTWDEAKNDYVNGTESLAAIAMRFGISKRAVEKRASDEGWAALRQAQSGQPSKTIRTHTPAPLPPLLSETLRERQSRQPQEKDEVEIINDAIASLSGILSGKVEDTRGIGGIATGLCRLIELRNKLVPKTAADLADMAIALGISPAEFIRALNDQAQSLPGGVSPRRTL